MIPADAKSLILFHAGFTVFSGQSGFLSRLRPYAGLNERDFADIILSIAVLHPVVVESPKIDRDLVSALWWICDQARVLALNTNSSVRRNSLATDTELVTLDSWILVIDYAAARMLQGRDLPDCLFRLLEYIADRPAADPANFHGLKPYLPRCIDSDDIDISEAAKRAAAVLDRD